MCVGKPKIDGARECGLCSYTGGLTEAVCKLSGHGALGQKGGMPECSNPCEKLEGTCWYLSLLYVFPVFEKGMMSVKEEHKGVVAVTGVDISKGWGLRICSVIFDLGAGSREHPKGDILTFRALLSQSEQRKSQLGSGAGCSEGSSAAAMAVWRC